MWARVSLYSGSPDSLDADLDYTRENIMPKVRELAGFQGIYAFADRDTGTTMSITLWDSEEDLRASDEAANQLRSDSTQHAGGSVVSVERYEVAYHELR
ncbi:MAG: hypothetical protein KY469_09560 [Actinobacteria bacterium]|nr:hypothetical protein [Actinomycetota bacterium]